ncbi:MAG TPA: hypothetical protein VIU82_18755 [Bosea sp. (in: a-proteobacteria)]
MSFDVEPVNANAENVIPFLEGAAVDQSAGHDATDRMTFVISNPAQFREAIARLQFQKKRRSIRRLTASAMLWSWECLFIWVCANSQPFEIKIISKVEINRIDWRGR